MGVSEGERSIVRKKHRQGSSKKKKREEKGEEKEVGDQGRQRNPSKHRRETRKGGYPPERWTARGWGGVGAKERPRKAKAEGGHPGRRKHDPLKRAKVTTRGKGRQNNRWMKGGGYQKNYPSSVKNDS